MEITSGPSPSPAPRPARWYHVERGEKLGPMPLAEIRTRVLDGRVAPETLVWADGMPDWMPAGEVPALVPPERADSPSRGQEAP